MAIFELISLPVPATALLAGLILGVLLSSLGIIASLRHMAFFGDGIAHASLAGIALALAAGLAPLPVTIIWSLFIAVVIYLLERKSRLPADTLIGIIFTASLAVGAIIMHLYPGADVDLESIIFGDLSTIAPIDLYLMFGLGAVILLWFFKSLKELTLISLSTESAVVAGIKVERQILLFYLALSVAVMLGIKMMGVVLVPAMLILPSAAARLLSNSFRSYVALSIILGVAYVLLGFIFSSISGLPSGPTVILTGAAGFALSLLVSSRRR